MRLALAAAVALAAAGIGAFALRSGEAPATSAAGPVWTEARWPFPVDPWGPGKAFSCKAHDCGRQVHLYVRAKLGFCNCTTGIAEDEDLDRMGDLELVGGGAAPLGSGRPITVGSMKGRARAYALTAPGGPGRTAISLALNERCDMIAGIAVMEGDAPATLETALLSFLDSTAMRRWTEVALGL
jgi:hypothetical protein